MKIEEDAVAGSPINQTAGVEGAVKPITPKPNIFRRVADIKKRRNETNAEAKVSLNKQ